MINYDAPNKNKKMKLLGVNSDSKTIKGNTLGVLTGILYLAPSKESGLINTCLYESVGCSNACIFGTGKGVFPSVKKARIAKTIRLVKEREAFMRQLIKDIQSLIRKSNKSGMMPAVRLNGTSDLPWQSMRIDGQSLLNHFPAVQFYDYTKDIAKTRLYAQGKLPANYHLTFSRSEENEGDTAEAIYLGVNVAIVFHGKELPTTFWGKTVIDGDLSDVRFADQSGVIVGLKAKGKAKKDKTGFVIHI